MSDPRRRRVLIVDDQPANVHLLAGALRDEYELFFATSAERALQLAREGGVDLVLLDVTMPGMDGFEACRHLKADDSTRTIPVIFVTARGEVDDETQGFAAGGVDYITKPISPPIVRARVRTHIELKDARDQLLEMASVDALTGIANRRRLDACLSDEWKRAARAHRWLTVVLLDVDFFKKFNDRYGHGRGDDCLRVVASALLAACRRPADLVARYGGEEFALVLPDTEPEGGRLLIEAALARVREAGLPHPDAPEGLVSVSAGALSLVPEGESLERDALEAADRLLYAAKQEGRNRALHEDRSTGLVTRIPGGAAREAAS